MSRVTKDMIDAKVIRLNRMGIPIIMEYEGEPQRPRAYLKPTEEEWLSNLSPRLPKGQMYEWLDAFEKGLDACEKFTKSKLIPFMEFTCPDCDHMARVTIRDALESGYPLCHKHVNLIEMEEKE